MAIERTFLLSFLLLFQSLCQLSFIVLHNFIVSGLYTYKYTCIIHFESNDLKQCDVQFIFLEKNGIHEAVGAWLYSGHPSFVGF